MTNLSVLIDVKPRLGEGLLWDVETQRLYFVDSLGCRVFRCTADGGEVRTWEVPSEVGAVALREDRDTLLLALRDGFHVLNLTTGGTEPLVNPEPDRPANRLNDGAVDPAGRFVAGSMDTGESDPTGALWRLDPDHSVHRLDGGIICSNGPCWSPDGGTFYFADSFTGTRVAYDYDVATGSVSNKRTFVEVESDGGAPDGACVDEEGYLWSATVFDGRVIRYAPDGSVDREIRMPVVKITNVAFGGPNLDRLYVTSMAHPPLPKYPGDGPQRGATFVVDGLGVRGLPERRFAG